MTKKELEKAFEHVSAIPQLMVGTTEEKTAIYVSSMKSHFDGLGVEYDTAEITAFVKEKMKALDAAGTKLPL
ncbi:MAG: hypothetical protein IJ109_10610 [Firmicutes bacterium]|nr:hypothetical protein [Bacillota bacterium]